MRKPQQQETLVLVTADFLAATLATTWTASVLADRDLDALVREFLAQLCALFDAREFLGAVDLEGLGEDGGEDGDSLGSCGAGDVGGWLACAGGHGDLEVHEGEAEALGRQWVLRSVGCGRG